MIHFAIQPWIIVVKYIKTLQMKLARQFFIIMSCENNNYTPPELDFPLLTRENIDNKAYQWTSDEIQEQLDKSTDILLVISDEDAFFACYSHMKQVKRGYCTKLGMVDFGQFGDENDENVKVALMRCSNINATSDMSKAVKNAAGVLCPKVALLVGICETMKPKKAKRGDVAISARLEICGGSKPDVRRNMARVNLSADDGWEPPLKDPNSFKVNVHKEAWMLTVHQPDDESQVDIDKLKNLYPNALVIEVGGEGR
jgi:hypothetical protein